MAEEVDGNLEGGKRCLGGRQVPPGNVSKCLGNVRIQAATYVGGPDTSFFLEHPVLFTESSPLDSGLTSGAVLL